MPCSIPLRINFSADTLWLCEDLQTDWARDLLEKNEQLKKQLKFLAVKEKLWKELNEVELTPIPESSALGRVAAPKKAVYCGLKAIEDVRFFAQV